MSETITLDRIFTWDISTVGFGGEFMKTFIAELKQVQARKLVSNDMEFRIILITDDSSVLELGKIPPDELIEVLIKKQK